MWSNQGGGNQGGSNQGGYDQGYGGDQGGGYLNSTAQFGSPGQSQGKKQQNRAQNSISCTVAQIQHSKQEDDRFMLDGFELHQITFVGLVRSVNDTATRMDYEIDDATGPPIEVKQFVDNDENTPDEERTPPMRENTYVRVLGHVRAFQDKRTVAAFRILPITDMNELVTHMLEVVYQHLFLTKGGAKTNQPAPADKGTGFVPQPTNQSNVQGQQQVADQGLSQMQTQVYNVIRGCGDEQGVSINLVCDNLRGIPQKSIRDAVEFLSSEGHIYSTIDDEHFKSTE